MDKAVSTSLNAGGQFVQALPSLGRVFFLCHPEKDGQRFELVRMI